MENPRSRTKVAMSYGALYGLTSTIIFLVFYFTKADLQSKWPQWLGYLALALFMIQGIKSYRDNELEGNISYSKSVGLGVLISIFGGIITAAFSVLFFTIIDPTMIQKIMDAAQQNMIQQGMSEEQIEMGMSYSRKFMTPGWVFVFSIIGSAFVGLILSLIISVFMKREQTPFNSNIG